VGIFSPSFPISAEAVETMRRYFESQGYEVLVAPNTLAVDGLMAGTSQQRADDLNSLLRNPSIRMVMTSIGGAGAIHLLPLIDYAALSADPKIIAALSDPSILLCAITACTGIPTFHGPNGVEFGGLDVLTPYSEENFWRLVSTELELPFAFPLGGAFQVLRDSVPREGCLFGGNLSRVCWLLGTPWEPDWRDIILFVEDVKIDPLITDVCLAHLRLAGVFERIQALLVDRPMEPQQPEGESLEHILLRNCTGYDWPIVNDLLIGHTDDKLTLPLGCRVGLEPSTGILQLLKPATAD
jgi:muramoyltetrapeptide carboxypeptidase